MLYGSLLYDAIPVSIMRLQVSFSDIILCCVTGKLYDVLSYYMISHYIIPYYMIQYLLYCIILDYVILPDTKLYQIVLYYKIIYYIMREDIIAYYIILCIVANSTELRLDWTMSWNELNNSIAD